MARPKAQLDQDQFEGLCRLQCTQIEILEWFGISDKTLRRWIKDTYGQDCSFSDIYAKKRAGGKVSLRRNQFKLSEHNAAMAIWLGKQYLGQRDRIEDDTPGTATAIADALKILRGDGDDADS